MQLKLRWERTLPTPPVLFLFVFLSFSGDDFWQSVWFTFTESSKTKKKNSKETVFDQFYFRFPLLCSVLLPLPLIIILLKCFLLIGLCHLLHQEHPFFRHTNWERMYNLQEEPPFRPMVVSLFGEETKRKTFWWAKKVFSGQQKVLTWWSYVERSLDQWWWLRVGRTKIMFARPKELFFFFFFFG